MSFVFGTLNLLLVSGLKSDRHWRCSAKTERVPHWDFHHTEGPDCSLGPRPLISEPEVESGHPAGSAIVCV